MFAWRDNFISYNGAAANNDPYWSYVQLLQNFEYQTPVSAYDLSSNNFQPMITGAARPSARTPFSSGNSYRFDTSTAAQIVIPQSSVFDAASNNFTLEFWVYIPSFPANNVEMVAIATNQTSAGQATARIVSTNAGAVYFLCNNSTNGWISTSTTAAGTLVVNTWYHMAGVRNGSNFTLYVNGVSKLSYTYAGVVGYLSAGNTTNIGNLPVGTGFTGASNCYITNVRFVNGTAVYTAGFTPPTTPLTAIANTQLLLTFPNQNQSSLPALVADQSNNAYPVTTGGNVGTNYDSPFSGYPGNWYFNNSYLDAVTQTGFNYAAGDFTVEGWFYLNAVGAQQFLIDQRNNGAGTSFTPTIYVDTTNVLVYYSNGAARITGATTMTTGVWYHVAASRASNTTRLFLNGVQQGSDYSDANTYTQTRVSFGRNASTGTGSSNIQCTSIRLSKGFAYYTTGFTPSTTPLTNNATYTSLLLNGNYNSAYDLSNSKVPVATVNWTGSLSSTAGGTTSTAISSPVQYKWGTQSLYIQRQSTTVGGYQRIEQVGSTINVFGTNNFCVEMWIYPTTSGVARGIIGKGTSTTGWALGLNSSNQLVWTSGSTAAKTSVTTISANTWTYIAISRIYGTGTGFMFINGIQEGSTFTDSANYTQTNTMFIGSDRTAGQNSFQGYIDDIRITNGVSRYSASFTAPTGPFPTS